jgi:sugar O-acyltransferase (sialic acid O-acetyltransferase NeuD family)
MQNPVMIFGANPIGRLAKEIFDSNGVVVYGFLDDDKKLHQTEIDEVQVLGSTDEPGFLKLIGKKCEGFVATDEIKLRKGLTKMLLDVRHVQPMNAVHQKAFVSPRAAIGYGNFIDVDVSIVSGATVGSHCLIQAKAYIGMDSSLGDFVQVGVGCVVSASVKIEDDVFIGAGAIIVSGITIGKGARVGVGSVVVASIKPGETVFGNPALPVKSLSG